MGTSTPVLILKLFKIVVTECEPGKLQAVQT